METHSQGMGREIREWNYWYNGEIISYPTQRLQRETIESLVGYYCHEFTYCHPDRGIVLLASREIGEGITTFSNGIKTSGNAIICLFYFPLYQFQCMCKDELIAKLKQGNVTYEKS